MVYRYRSPVKSYDYGYMELPYREFTADKVDNLIKDKDQELQLIMKHLNETNKLLEKLVELNTPQPREPWTVMMGNRQQIVCGVLLGLVLFECTAASVGWHIRPSTLISSAVRWIWNQTKRTVSSCSTFFRSTQNSMYIPYILLFLSMLNTGYHIGYRSKLISGLLHKLSVICG